MDDFMPRAVSKTPEAIFGGTTGGRRSGDTWMLRQGGGFTKPGEEGALLSACVGCGFVLGTPGRGLPSQSGFKIDEVSRWPALRLDIAGCERVAGFEIAITVHGTLETLASMAAALKRIAEQADRDNPIIGVAEREALTAELARLPPGAPQEARIELLGPLAEALLWGGDSAQAVARLREASALVASLPPERGGAYAAQVDFALAVALMRLGEDQNCVRRHNEFSCIAPIRGAGVHTEKAAATEAALTGVSELALPGGGGTCTSWRKVRMCLRKASHASVILSASKAAASILRLTNSAMRFTSASLTSGRSASEGGETTKRSRSSNAPEHVCQCFAADAASRRTSE
jgi:hypothetical protein